MRDNKLRLKITLIFLFSYLALKIFHAISSYAEYDLLFKIRNYGYVLSDEKAEADDTRQRVIAVLSLLAYIGTAIAFLYWIARAYHNLQCRSNFTNYTYKQAVYYWIIPILWLYKPYQVVKDLFLETDNILEERTEDYIPQTSVGQLSLWWAFWIIKNLYEYIFFKFSFNDVEGFMTRDILYMTDTAITLIGGCLFYMVLRKYRRMELLLQNIVDTTAEDEIPPESKNYLDTEGESGAIC